MATRRWFVSLAGAAGLVGSLLLSAPSSAAVDARTSDADRSLTPAGPLQWPAREQAVEDDKQRRQDRPPGPGDEKDGCLGLVPTPYPYANTEFVCNDWRFGPVDLPRSGVLGSILSGYDRFGTLTPVEFLNKWWDPTMDVGQGNWKYPPDDGFDHDTAGKVIANEVTLHPGQLLDRFGNEFGSFLSPAGAKYKERALPPSNLNTEDPRYPYNYHLYRVKKDTLVCAGPIAPAFEQPGQGVQYVTSFSRKRTYCTHVPTDKTVHALVQDGNLERAN